MYARTYMHCSVSCDTNCIFLFIDITSSIYTSVKNHFHKMYEDVGMAECRKPVKLGGCMQAGQGWWHITKCLTIVTPCLKDVRIGVTMVKHFAICNHPCLACIQPPSFTGFCHSAIRTPSYIFHEKSTLVSLYCNYSVHTALKRMLVFTD